MSNEMEKEIGMIDDSNGKQPEEPRLLKCECGNTAFEMLNKDELSVSCLFCGKKYILFIIETSNPEWERE